jgi:hypothetical protein
VAILFTPACEWVETVKRTIFSDETLYSLVEVY